MKKFTLFFFWIFFSAVCIAQWSGDPAVNTFVAGTGLDRTYAKIAADPTGSFYVSHWAAVPDSAVNFNVWLQRLDHQGNRLLGNDGIRISAHPSRSWISGYDLTADSAGNAVIAFEDMRAADGFSHVYLYCYDASGNPVWDSAGVQADTGMFMSYSPVLAVTGKGNILVAWNCVYRIDTIEKEGIRIMKYSPSGQPLWNGAIALNEPDSTNMFPVIIPVQEDDFILVWQRKFEKGAGIGTEWYTYIRAQRFDSAGLPVWPQDVLVCDHGDSAYVMPQFIIVSTVKDENEGVYISWFDDRYKAMYCNIYVQYLDQDGNERWIKNGIPVSLLNAGYDRVEPALVYEPGGQDLYLAWDEYRPEGIYLSFGLCAQKINMQGELLWGDTGKIFKDFKLDTIYYINAFRLTPMNDLLLQYEQEYDSILGQDTLLFDQLYASRIDTSGAFVWAPIYTLMAATSGTKFYPGMSAFSDGIYAVTWAENRDSPFSPYGSIYAQDIDLNGKLGPLSVPGQSNPDGSVKIYPNPSGTAAWLIFSTVATGPAEIHIFNLTGQEVSFIRESITPGSKLISLDASRINPGVYLVRILFNGNVQTVKWVVTY